MPTLGFNKQATNEERALHTAERLEEKKHMRALHKLSYIYKKTDTDHKPKYTPKVIRDRLKQYGITMEFAKKHAEEVYAYASSDLKEETPKKTSKKKIKKS